MQSPDSIIWGFNKNTKYPETHDKILTIGNIAQVPFLDEYPEEELLCVIL